MDRSTATCHSSTANGLKYAALLTSAAILAVRAHLPTAALLLPALSAGFAAWWDVAVDWGGRAALRSPAEVAVVCVNTAIRFLPLLCGTAVSPVLLNGVEVGRRSLWTVLRIRCHYRQTAAVNN